MMRNLCIVLTLVFCASTASKADGFDGSDNEDTYRQCVAKSARSTASMLAFQVMQNACLRLYRQTSALSDADKSYYLCLLRKLPGVNNDIHAQMAAKACGEPR
ncbi:VF_A0006 family four-cysteine protein [Paraburkholderia phymatum]|nr:VF_A0006 family four-cysteine protein [Paraburkholderia phymatum]